MFALPLHTGTEHPNLLLMVLSGLAAFAAGLGVGTFGTRFREFLRDLASGSDAAE